MSPIELANTLTTTQKEIVHLVLQGQKNYQISQILKIKDKTIKYHLTNIFKKLKIKGRRQLFSQHLKKYADVSNNRDLFEKLSFTQKRVLQLIIFGHSNNQIAHTMGTSVQGVKHRVTRAYKKLQIKSSRELFLNYQSILLEKAFV